MKKFLSILLSLALCLGLCPTGALASETPTLPNNLEGSTVEVVEKGQVMETNEGVILYNYGTVVTNNGTILRNEGTVETNNGDTTYQLFGEISYNAGTIKDNQNTVFHNPGTIGVNTGEVYNNSGVVKESKVPSRIYTIDGGKVEKRESPKSHWYEIKLADGIENAYFTGSPADEATGRACIGYSETGNDNATLSAAAGYILKSVEVVGDEYKEKYIISADGKTCTFPYPKEEEKAVTGVITVSAEVERVAPEGAIAEVLWKELENNVYVIKSTKYLTTLDDLLAAFNKGEAGFGTGSEIGLIKDVDIGGSVIQCTGKLTSDTTSRIKLNGWGHKLTGHGTATIEVASDSGMYLQNVTVENTAEDGSGIKLSGGDIRVADGKGLWLFPFQIIGKGHTVEITDGGTVCFNGLGISSIISVTLDGQRIEPDRVGAGGTDKESYFLNSFAPGTLRVGWMIGHGEHTFGEGGYCESCGEKLMDDPAAKMGSKYLDEAGLAEAFQSVNSIKNTTLTLLRDVELEAPLYFLGENITLDCGGHTLTGTERTTINVCGGSLTVKNGTVENTAEDGIGIEESSGALTVKSDASISGLIGGIDCSSGTATVEGTVYGGSWGVKFMMGSLTLNGGEISGNEIGLSASYKSDVTLVSGRITGDETAISIDKEYPPKLADGSAATLDGQPLEFPLTGDVGAGTVYIYKADHAHQLKEGTNTCGVCGMKLVAEEMIGGETKLFATAQELGMELANYLREGDEPVTITLLDDIEGEDGFSIQCKPPLTLDLNRHNITVEGSNAVNVVDGSKLTIVGPGTIECTGEYESAVWVYDGTLTIGDTGVTLKGKGYGLYIWSLSGDVTLDITGGTYIGGTGAITGGKELREYFGEGYGFFEGNTPVMNWFEYYTLPQTEVTVKPCAHNYEGCWRCGPDEEPAGLHTGECLVCGLREDPEKCSYTFDGNVGTCARCGEKVTVSVTATENLTYDGTAKNPDVAVEWNTGRHEDYSVAYADNLNAGTASVTVTSASWEYTQKFTISKAPLTVTAQDQTVTYGEGIAAGPAQAACTGLCTGDVLDSITLTPSRLDVPGGKITASGAVIKNAGGQVVTGNYTIAYKDGTLTINKADQDAPAAPTAEDANIKDTSITLNTITNAEYSKDRTTWQESPEFTGLEPNHTYTFYARLKEDSNHNPSPDSEAASITTKKTMLNDAVVTVSGTYTYDGTAQVPSAEQVTVTLNGTEIPSGQYTISGSSINAGEATVTITAAADGNYTGTASGKFTIDKATLTADGTGIAKGTYGDKLSGLTVEGLTAKLGETVIAGTWKLTGDAVPNVGDSGEYTAAFTPDSGAGNYEPLTAKVTLNIAQAEYNGAKTANVSAKFGTTGTYDLSALLPEGAAAGTPTTESGIFDGVPTVSGKTLGYTLKADAEVDSTGTITVPVTSTNYKDFSLTITVKVSDKDVPALTTSPITVTYTGNAIDGKLITGTAKVGDKEVTGTWEFDAGQNLTNVSDSGTKNVTFTPTNENDYSEAHGTVVVKIEPASIAGAAVILSDTAFKGNGAAHSPSITSVKLGDTVLTADTDYTAEIPSEKDAGTYTVTVTGKGNYTGTVSVEFVIHAVQPLDPPANVVADEDAQVKLEMEVGLSDVPAELLTKLGIESAAQLESELRAKVVQTGATQDNTAVYDVMLMVSDDDGKIWKPATKENFPAGGLTVTLPYPEGTDSSYQFVVVHMFTSSDFGKEVGDTETPTVTTTDKGIQFTVTGLSPISIGWTKKSSGGSGGGGGYPSVSYYTVKVAQAKHGKVTASPTSVYSGGTVTLTVTPDEGYKLDKISVTDSQNKAVELTEKDGKYTFKMPSRNVEVQAEFTQISAETPSPSPSPKPWKNPFTDVKDTAWYIKAVEYVAGAGLMSGYGNGKFGPNDTLTRAQFAQIIYNKEGSPSVESDRFTDVKSGRWYANAVNWAAAQGIVAGIGNNKYAPNDPITREQLATMLWRYAGSPEPRKNDLDFTDAGKVSDYAWKAMLWANENGIVNGKGNGVLDPKGRATRAEAAQMLKNYFK